MDDSDTEGSRERERKKERKGKNVFARSAILFSRIVSGERRASDRVINRLIIGFSSAILCSSLMYRECTYCRAAAPTSPSLFLSLLHLLPSRQPLTPTPTRFLVLPFFLARSSSVYNYHPDAAALQRALLLARLSRGQYNNDAIVATV